MQYKEWDCHQVEEDKTIFVFPWTINQIALYLCPLHSLTDPAALWNSTGNLLRSAKHGGTGLLSGSRETTSTSLTGNKLSPPTTIYSNPEKSKTMHDAYLPDAGTMILMDNSGFYRDEIDSLYVVWWILFLLFLNCSAWPCLGPA